MYNSYSQQLEDIFLYHELVDVSDKCSKVFVEIGAFDGLECSNSKFFEDVLGFKCYLIEPGTQNFSKLQFNRPNSVLSKCAIGLDSGKANYIIGGGVGGLQNSMTDNHLRTWYSFFSGTEEVEVKTFSQYTKEMGIDRIHILSIDCECGDFNVIKSIDFDNVEIDIILVEVQEEYRVPLELFLVKNNFSLKTHLFGNQIWVSKKYIQYQRPEVNNISWRPLYLEGSLIQKSRELCYNLTGSPNLVTQ